MSVSIVIPAYNEEKSLASVVGRIKVLYPQFDILVVDDGSTDRTGDVASAAGATVIRHPYNKGNGAAVKTGIRQATTVYVVIIDADGQHDPANIADLLNYLPEYDAVVGARSRGSMSHGRRIANSFLCMVAEYVAEQRIDDLTSGFRAFKREVILRFLPLLPNAFSTPATSTISLIKAGYSIKFVPVECKARFSGNSKVRAHDVLRFLIILLRVAVLFSPLRIFLPFSIITFLTGIIYSGFVWIMLGRFTNMGELLIITSVIIFMLGLISEQVAMLRSSLTRDDHKE